MKTLIFTIVIALCACEKVKTYEPSPEKRQQDIENQSLADAKKLAEKGDLDGAHKTLSQIGLDAPARRTGEFVEIENRWAEAQIAKADAEPDVPKKIALLQDVSKASAVSGELRAKASNKLALAIPDPSLPPILVNYDPELARANVAACKALLKQVKLKEAKALLYPRVIGGIASPEEQQMLTTLCMKDQSCVSALQDAGVINESQATSLMATAPPPGVKGKCAACPK